MSINAKKTGNGFRAWICFFIGLNILLVLISAGIIITIKNYDQLQYMDDLADLTISGDILDTHVTKSIIADHISYLLRMSKNTGTDPRKNVRGTVMFNELERELANIACFVRNKNGAAVYDTLPDPGSEVSKIKYNFLVQIDKSSITIYRSNDRNLLSEDLSDSILDYKVKIDESYAEITRTVDNFRDENPDNGDFFVQYALCSDPVNYPDSALYIVKQARMWIRIGAAALIITIITALLLIFYSYIKREDKRAFLRKYSALVSKIWLECKLASIAFVSYITFFLCIELPNIYHYSYAELVLIFAILIACFWFFYLVVKDIQYNKAEFFKQNIIRSLTRIIGRLVKRFKFEKRMVAGFWGLAISEIVLVILFAGSFNSSDIAPTLFFFMGIALFILAAIRYHRFIADTGKLVSQIGRIKSGDFATGLTLNSNSALQECAENLNSIQAGMSKALEERLASERLKVDLITNVSHDLKTPLTSIISYIDLLKKENLPAQAMEYAEILSQKADRLKTMIQDVFIVSKAASGNLAVEKELLDLGRLVEQTLADMQERIETSDLTFRVMNADKPLIIRSDGQKLYRVFQNLIDNALCYSLKGSRVYVRLWSEGGSAMVEIKNTSGHELNFTPQEIVERFVRGDTSRSGDGSGLGLSIAQTFTEACGGSFSISIDYDDFRVRLSFPQEPASSAPQMHSIEVSDNVHKNPEVIDVLSPKPCNEKDEGMEICETETTVATGAEDAVDTTQLENAASIAENADAKDADIEDTTTATGSGNETDTALTENTMNTAENPDSKDAGIRDMTIAADSLNNL